MVIISLSWGREGAEPLAQLGDRLITLGHDVGLPCAVLAQLFELGASCRRLGLGVADDPAGDTSSGHRFCARDWSDTRAPELGRVEERQRLMLARDDDDVGAGDQLEPLRAPSCGLYLPARNSSSSITRVVRSG